MISPEALNVMQGMGGRPRPSYPQRPVGLPTPPGRGLSALRDPGWGTQNEWMKQQMLPQDSAPQVEPVARPAVEPAVLNVEGGGAADPLAAPSLQPSTRGMGMRGFDPRRLAMLRAMQMQQPRVY